MTRVLVVEDEESYSDALAYMLRKEGFEVSLASTGPDALTEFERTGADIVLLDLMLPGLPGTEVCRRIRQVSNVPVIMVSAKDSEVDKVVGLELGADDYVTKPYAPREPSPGSGRCCARAGRRGRPAVARGRSGADGRRAPRRHGQRRGHRSRSRSSSCSRCSCATPTGCSPAVLDRPGLGSDYVGDTKTLDVHVKRLRAKIEPDPAPRRTSSRCAGSAKPSRPGQQPERASVLSAPTVSVARVSDRPRVLPLVAVGVTLVFWASAFVAIRHLGDHVGPGALSLGRLLVGSLCRRGPARPARLAAADPGRLAAAGGDRVLWFGVYNVALNEGERRVDAGTAAMLIQVSPVLIAVLAVLFLGSARLRRCGPASRSRSRGSPRSASRPARAATATCSACCCACSRPRSTRSA